MLNLLLRGGRTRGAILMLWHAECITIYNNKFYVNFEIQVSLRRKRCDAEKFPGHWWAECVRDHAATAHLWIVSVLVYDLAPCANNLYMLWIYCNYIQLTYLEVDYILPWLLYEFIYQLHLHSVVCTYYNCRPLTLSTIDYMHCALLLMHYSGPQVKFPVLELIEPYWDEADLVHSTMLYIRRSKIFSSCRYRPLTRSTRYIGIYQSLGN